MHGIVHGIVLKGLKEFVTAEYGADVWTELHEAAGLRTRLYVPVTEYSDEIVFELIGAATERTGLEESTLLTAFGRSLVPQLLSTYASMSTASGPVSS